MKGTDLNAAKDLTTLLRIPFVLDSILELSSRKLNSYGTTLCSDLPKAVVSDRHDRTKISVG